MVQPGVGAEMCGTNWPWCDFAGIESLDVLADMLLNRDFQKPIFYYTEYYNNFEGVTMVLYRTYKLHTRSPYFKLSSSPQHQRRLESLPRDTDNGAGDGAIAKLGTFRKTLVEPWVTLPLCKLPSAMQSRFCTGVPETIWRAVSGVVSHTVQGFTFSCE